MQLIGKPPGGGNPPAIGIPPEMIKDADGNMWMLVARMVFIDDEDGKPVLHQKAVRPNTLVAGQILETFVPVGTLEVKDPGGKAN